MKDPTHSLATEWIERVRHKDRQRERERERERIKRYLKRGWKPKTTKRSRTRYGVI